MTMHTCHGGLKSGGRILKSYVLFGNSKEGHIDDGTVEEGKLTSAADVLVWIRTYLLLKGLEDAKRL